MGRAKDRSLFLGRRLAAKNAKKFGKSNFSHKLSTEETNVLRVAITQRGTNLATSAVAIRHVDSNSNLINLGLMTHFRAKKSSTP